MARAADFLMGVVLMVAVSASMFAGEQGVMSEQSKNLLQELEFVFDKTKKPLEQGHDFMLKLYGLLCRVVTQKESDLLNYLLREYGYAEFGASSDNPFAVSFLYTAPGGADASTIPVVIEGEMNCSQLAQVIDKTSPLHYAARGGLREVVEQLVGAGAQINNTCGAHSMTPLHEVARGCRCEKKKAAECGHVQVVRFLIEQDADKTIVDKSERKCTACAYAVKNGNRYMMLLLNPLVCNAGQAKVAHLSCKAQAASKLSRDPSADGY
ncbi:MAG: ankyrin repeat domain-containing protein [Epsilonproteobacteria bacterium]|nr:ankyrin repeat domain-containing protein [Campylobacterota bacterium]